MVGLIGPNGAGKTTFMKILVRQLLASGGSIKVDGTDADKNENYFKSRLVLLSAHIIEDVESICNGLFWIFVSTGIFRYGISCVVRSRR